jgi:hypothetical protein
LLAVQLAVVKNWCEEQLVAVAVAGKRGKKPDPTGL